MYLKPIMVILWIFMQVPIPNLSLTDLHQQPYLFRLLKIRAPDVAISPQQRCIKCVFKLDFFLWTLLSTFFVYISCINIRHTEPWLNNTGVNKAGEGNSKHQLKIHALKSQCDSLRQERHPVHVRSHCQYILMHILLLEHSYLGDIMGSGLPCSPHL